MLINIVGPLIFLSIKRYKIIKSIFNSVKFDLEFDDNRFKYLNIYFLKKLSHNNKLI